MHIILYPELLLLLFIVVGIFAIAKASTVKRTQSDQDDADEDSIPQMDCPGCGQSHDMDYYICPHCKHRYNIGDSLLQSYRDITQTRCQRCGAKRGIDRNICPNCDYSHNDAPDSPKETDRHGIAQTQCPMCGTTHDQDYHTCPYCGHTYRCKYTYRED